jgi:mono/diheme cytochrome c family protein
MKGIGSSWVLGGLLAGTVLLAGFWAGSVAAAPVSSSDQASNQASALAAFDTIQTVLQHPRCQNCHIPGDAPLQLDAGLVHNQNVKRGPEGTGAPGLPCSACHGTRNLPASYGAHMPPGAPKWNLPPPERKMVFIGLPKGELCANLKDTKRNGGKDLPALLEHVSHDKLVLWGWDPGVGRVPVSVPHDRFVAAFKTWMAGGAPCP